MCEYCNEELKMFEKIIFPRACENYNKTMPRIDVL